MMHNHNLPVNLISTACKVLINVDIVFYIVFQSLVSSVVNVIKNTGEGALEVFQLLLENCQKPEVIGNV